MNIPVLGATAHALNEFAAWCLFRTPARRFTVPSRDREKQ
jgi:hypothetical protein